MRNLDRAAKKLIRALVCASWVLDSPTSTRAYVNYRDCTTLRLFGPEYETSTNFPALTLCQARILHVNAKSDTNVYGALLRTIIWDKLKYNDPITSSGRQTRV